VDVSVHAVARESAHAPSQQSSPVQIEERETAAAPAIADVTDAATEILDLPAADSEQERVLPADGENLAELTAADVADRKGGLRYDALELQSTVGRDLEPPMTKRSQEVLCYESVAALACWSSF